MNIKEKLADLHKQATTDRSHYYVGSVCEEALRRILELEKQVDLCAPSTRDVEGAIKVFLIESEGKISLDSEVINSCRFLFREALAKLAALRKGNGV